MRVSSTRTAAAHPQGRGRLVAYVGSYEHSPNPHGGGIYLLEVSADGCRLAVQAHIAEPRQAGYLAYAPAWGMLYAVDERKTDGRGPVQPAARVHAFAVSQQDGSLTWLNAQLAPGPFPTFLSVDEAQRIVVCANHGSFDHIERVIQTADGTWTTEYLYDDSTVILYNVEADGHLGPIRDLRVLTGHGKDPNHSPQAGGHGQASAHAHCAVIDPSGQYVVVCDKATDQILVFRLGSKLELASTYQLPEETGPRHVAFDPASGRAFVTFEFSSELGSFDFDPASAKLWLLDTQPTTDRGYDGPNEPAEVRAHPGGKFVYVNNRGEDSVAWFRAGSSGELTRIGHVCLATSIHPGLAARSFTFDPTGSFLLVADRPANLIRSYAVNHQDGSLQPLAEAAVPNPAFVAFATLGG
jgi:6-phosphogluconolactonase